MKTSKWSQITLCILTNVLTSISERFCPNFEQIKIPPRPVGNRAFIKHIIIQKLTEFIHEFILHNKELKLIRKSIQNHHSLTILFAQHFPRWPHMDNKFELHHGMYNLEWNFHGSLSKCVSFSLHSKNDRRKHFTHFCQSIISFEGILTFYFLTLKAGVNMNLSEI